MRAEVALRMRTASVRNRRQRRRVVELLLQGEEMRMSELARIIATTTVLVAVPLVTAIAQTQSPPPSPPAATTPQTAPPAPQTTPSTAPAEKKAAAPLATDMVGLTAKSSDGTNLGTVHSVATGPGGKVSIGVKVGGFLGFGGHMVAIPDDKFNRIGDTVQVNMSADEVNKLPKVSEK